MKRFIFLVALAAMVASSALADGPLVHLSKSTPTITGVGFLLQDPTTSPRDLITYVSCVTDAIRIVPYKYANNAWSHTLGAGAYADTNQAIAFAGEEIPIIGKYHLLNITAINTTGVTVRVKMYKE